jgi:plasmid stabilization system protein ParE
MRRFAVLLLPEAVREIDAAREWWAEHGRGRVLDDAIASALRRLEVCPEMGPLAPSRSKRSTMRRVLLRRVRYHLYYRLDMAAERIIVSSFWHTSRRPRRF